MQTFSHSSVLRLLPFLAVTAGLAGAPLVCAAPPAPDGAGARVTFADSVRELPAVQKATLRAMTAEHMTDRVGFNIPLALRNQAELEARVSRGEVLSGEEMRAKYLPLPADYDLVAAWLRSEGFVVDEFGGAPLAVFAHGTAAQVQSSLGWRWPRSPPMARSVWRQARRRACRPPSRGRPSESAA